MRLSHKLAVIILILVGVALYANSLGNGFVMDDRYFVKDNSFIDSLSNLKHIFNAEKYFEGSLEGTYRPVTTVTYFVDRAVWGTGPFGFHLTNIIIHILNSVFFYFILVNFLAASRGDVIKLPENDAYRRLLPLLAALFFLSNPVQTETVNNIGTRPDALMALFYFVSIFFYQKCRASERQRGIVFYFISLAAYLLSCFSKEMGITLLAILILLDMFRTGGIKKKDLLFYAGYALIAVFFLYVRFIKMQYPGESGMDFFDSTRLLLTGRMLSTYFGLFLFPFRLSAEYAFGGIFPESIPGSVLDPVVVVPSLIVLAVLVFVIWCRKRFPMLFFGGAWFFITILPVSNIFFRLMQFPIRERYIYLPTAGFCIFLTFALYRLSRVRIGSIDPVVIRRTVLYSTGILLCLYCTRTITRNFDWKDATTIWSATLKTSPGSYRAYYNLGMGYQYEKGETQKSIEAFKKSLELKDFAMTHDALGFVYLQEGRYQEAKKELETANRMRPDIGSVYYHLGVLYLATGENDKAIETQKKGLSLGKRTFETLWVPLPYADIHGVMGVAYFNKGEYDKAIEQFKAAVAIGGDHPDIDLYLARSYFLIGRYDMAVEVYKKALKKYPDNFNVRFALATAYLKKGMYDEAKEEYSRILEKNPTHVDARNNLANIYFYTGETDKAVEEYLRIIEMDPSHSRARNNLGNIYLSKELYDKAIAEYEKVLEKEPDNTIVLYNLGLAYMKKGMIEEAQKEWQRALEIDPGFSSARKALNDTSQKGVKEGADE